MSSWYRFPNAIAIAGKNIKTNGQFYCQHISNHVPHRFINAIAMAVKPTNEAIQHAYNLSHRIANKFA